MKKVKNKNHLHEMNKDAEVISWNRSVHKWLIIWLIINYLTEASKWLLLENKTNQGDVQRIEIPKGNLKFPDSLLLQQIPSLQAWIVSYSYKLLLVGKKLFRVSEKIEKGPYFISLKGKIYEILRYM